MSNTDTKSSVMEGGAMAFLSIFMLHFVSIEHRSLGALLAGGLLHFVGGDRPSRAGWVAKKRGSSGA